MRRFFVITAAAAVLGAPLAVAAGAPAAYASPSCIAQSATSFEPGQLGPTLSGYARTYPPLGATVSFEATSPKDACPPE
jgi:hypothetical protein